MCRITAGMRRRRLGYVGERDEQELQWEAVGDWAGSSAFKRSTLLLLPKRDPVSDSTRPTQVTHTICVWAEASELSVRR